MLLLIVILTGLCMYAEMKIVTSVPGLGSVLERFRLASLAFSVVLSVMLGTIFGAAGLICFMAGMLSTVAIQPWYAMRKSGQLDRMHASYNSSKKEVMHWLDQLAKLVVVLFKIATMPVVVLFAILDAVEKMTNKATQGGSKYGR